MTTLRPAAALPALLALLVLTGCAGTSSPDAAGPTSLAPTTVAAPAPADTAVPGESPPASASPSAGSDVKSLTLTVAGSTVTGDTGTVDVRLGQPVQLTVTSDVADEVHVHGADVSADVDAGGTVVLDFVQQAPGRFEVELEERKQVLTRLQVS